MRAPARELLVPFLTPLAWRGRGSNLRTPTPEPDFLSNLPQNMLQPFPHASDAICKIWSRLANLQVWKCGQWGTTDHDRWTADHCYTITSPCKLWFRWAKNQETSSVVMILSFQTYRSSRATEIVKSKSVRSTDDVIDVIRTWVRQSQIVTKTLHFHPKVYQKLIIFLIESNSNLL